jgi:hypothetical protein
MKRLFSIIAVAGALVWTAGSFYSCNSSTGTGPTGSVSGKVTFLNTGSWPSSGDVQVSVYSALPPDGVPAGPPDGYTLPITSGSLDYSYKIAGLDLAHYVAVFVSWRNPAIPGSATLLGVYWAYPDSVGVASNGTKIAPQAPGPTGVSLTKSKPDAKNLDFVADLSLAP